MGNVSPDINCNTDHIKHEGSIQKIEKNTYFISITAQSACAMCHSRGNCNFGEIREKIIEVPMQPDENFKVGDTVEVLMKKSMGTKAVFLGYILPFILLLSSLVAAFEIFKNEALAGIFAIGMITIYYLILNLLKGKLKKTFHFNIRHIKKTFN